MIFIFVVASDLRVTFEVPLHQNTHPSYRNGMVLSSGGWLSRLFENPTSVATTGPVGGNMLTSSVEWLESGYRDEEFTKKLPRGKNICWHQR